MLTPEQDSYFGLVLEFAGLLALVVLGVYSALHHAGILIGLALATVAIICGKKIRGGSVKI